VLVACVVGTWRTWYY